MLNVLQSFYEFSNDPRVVPFLLKYHQWLNSQPGEYFGNGYWPKIRFGDNIETARAIGRDIAQHFPVGTRGEPSLNQVGRDVGLAAEFLE